MQKDKNNERNRKQDKLTLRDFWEGLKQVWSITSWRLELNLSPRGYVLYMLLYLVIGVILMVRGINILNVDQITEINNNIMSINIINLLLFYGGFAIGLFSIINFMKHVFTMMEKSKKISVYEQHYLLFDTLENDITELLEEVME